MIFFYKFKILNLYNYLKNFNLNFGYLNCLNFCNIEFIYNLKLNLNFYFCFYKFNNYFISTDLKKDYIKNNFKYINFLRIINSKFLIKLNNLYNNYYLKIYEKYNNYYVFDHIIFKLIHFKNFEKNFFIKLNFIKFYKVLFINYFNYHNFFNYNFINLIFNSILIKFLNF